MSYHGYPCATGDMDLWAARHPENARKLMEALRDFGFNVPELSTDLFLEEDRVICMGHSPVRIELSTSVSGVRFDEGYADRVTDILDGVEVPIISLVHLKANKQTNERADDSRI